MEGSASFYLFLARFRPPSFLERNIEAVLLELENRKRREQTVLQEWGPRRRKPLNQISDRLKPPILNVGEPEPVLRIGGGHLIGRLLSGPLVQHPPSSGKFVEKMELLWN